MGYDKIQSIVKNENQLQLFMSYKNKRLRSNKSQSVCAYTNPSAGPVYERDQTMSSLCPQTPKHLTLQGHQQAHAVLTFYLDICSFRFSQYPCCRFHYIDVIMTTMASQITSITVAYSTVYSDADQRKHQSSVSLAFVWGIHRDRWIPRTKGQLRRNVSIWWRHHVKMDHQISRNVAALVVLRMAR